MTVYKHLLTMFIPCHDRSNKMISIQCRCKITSKMYKNYILSKSNAYGLNQYLKEDWQILHFFLSLCVHVLQYRNLQYYQLFLFLTDERKTICIIDVQSITCHVFQVLSSLQSITCHVFYVLSCVLGVVMFFRCCQACFMQGYEPLLNLLCNRISDALKHIKLKGQCQYLVKKFPKRK